MCHEPVGSRHSDVLEDDLAGGLHVPPHLVLLLAEAEAGRAVGDHHGGDGLSSANHDQVQIRETCESDMDQNVHIQDISTQ